MRAVGKAWIYGDDIDTDVMYPGKYLVYFDYGAAKRHAMAGLESGFCEKIAVGDLLVAGRNFGCGSAREQATLALKSAGVAAVLADSFARSFFRNAINLGLPIVELAGASQTIAEGNRLEVDLEAALVRNLTTGTELRGVPLPALALEILRHGGAIPYYKRRMAQPGVGGVGTEATGPR